MDDDLIVNALYLNRPPDDFDLIASLFGTWCQRVWDGQLSMVPISTMFHHIMSGAPEGEDEEEGENQLGSGALKFSVMDIVRLVAPYHKDARLFYIQDPPVRDAENRSLETPEISTSSRTLGLLVHPLSSKELACEDLCMTSAKGHGFAVVPKVLLMFETYLFELQWPERLQALLHAEKILGDGTLQRAIVKTMGPAPNKDWVIRWLARCPVLSEVVEPRCRENYSNMKIPIRAALRTNPATAFYVKYRNLDDVYKDDPVYKHAAWKTDMTYALDRMPRLILRTWAGDQHAAAGHDPRAVTAAGLAIFTTFLEVGAGLPVKVVRIRSNGNAGVNFCPPWSIYVDDTIAVVSFERGRYYTLASCNIEDIVHGVIAAACDFLPATERGKLELVLTEISTPPTTYNGRKRPIYLE